MPITNLPVGLQSAIQQNLLQTAFQQSLRPALVYRSICQREYFDIHKGQTMTYTRAGLKPPIHKPLNPAQNTNLDNGLTPKAISTEQYTMEINQYGDTMDLDIMTTQVMIANLALQYATTNGQQAGSSLDTLAKNKLYDSYMGGNTSVRTTLGAPGTTIAVNDIRGFDKVLGNDGKIYPINATYPLTVRVGSNEYDLISVAPDATNVSPTRYRYDNNGHIIGGTGGISGTMTFATNVTVADGTAGNAVVSKFAPVILRPNNKATTGALASTDVLTMQLVMDAVTVLRNNAIPTVDDYYHCYLDDTSMNQLFKDEEFQLLYRGRTLEDEVYKHARVYEGLNVRFFTTTQAPQQLLSFDTGIPVHRPIICGADTIVEGTFSGQTAIVESSMKGNAHIEAIDDIMMIVRPPIDRLEQIVAMSWSWTGGYAVPQDATANRSVIGTANDAYFKRAIILETA